eukprot:1054041-Amphidinium_carterae.1
MQANAGSIEVHRGEGCVIYVGLSGFTELTERSAGRDNGAELLSKCAAQSWHLMQSYDVTFGWACLSSCGRYVDLRRCLTQFFTPLIDLIHAYRGDVIKFSGKVL